MLTMLLSALLVPSAAANPVSVDVQLGWLGTEDPRWEAFSDRSSYGTWGLRVGYDLTPKLAVIVGWQQGVTGAETVYEGGDNYEEEFSAYTAAFYGEQLTAGVRAGLPVGRHLYPYLTLSGVGLGAMVRFDDNLADDENLNQLKRVGFSGGALATGGLEYRIPIGEEGGLTLHTELGYGWVAPVAFKDVGAVGFSGFSGRAGLGVRF